jgi:hypothetical protein
VCAGVTSGSGGVAVAGGARAPGANREAIVAVVRERPDVTAGEIASATGIARATVSSTAARLAGGGRLSALSCLAAASGFACRTRQRLTRLPRQLPGRRRLRVAATARSRPRSRAYRDVTTLNEALCRGDTRNVRVSSDRRKCRFPGTYDAGGGTRTPDTRIMIPRSFRSTEPRIGTGGHKRGHKRASACRHSGALGSWR